MMPTPSSYESLQKLGKELAKSTRLRKKADEKCRKENPSKAFSACRDNQLVLTFPNGNSIRLPHPCRVATIIRNYFSMSNLLDKAKNVPSDKRTQRRSSFPWNQASIDEQIELVLAYVQGDITGTQFCIAASGEPMNSNPMTKIGPLLRRASESGKVMIVKEGEEEA